MAKERRVMSHLANETYVYSQKGGEKRDGNSGILSWQKRPTCVPKETYVQRKKRGKRDLNGETMSQ